MSADDTRDAMSAEAKEEWEGSAAQTRATTGKQHLSERKGAVEIRGADIGIEWLTMSRPSDPSWQMDQTTQGAGMHTLTAAAVATDDSLSKLSAPSPLMAVATPLTSQTVLASDTQIEPSLTSSYPTARARPFTPSLSPPSPSPSLSSSPLSLPQSSTSSNPSFIAAMALALFASLALISIALLAYRNRILTRKLARLSTISTSSLNSPHSSSNHTSSHSSHQSSGSLPTPDIPYADLSLPSRPTPHRIHTRSAFKRKNPPAPLPLDSLSPATLPPLPARTPTPELIRSSAALPPPLSASAENVPGRVYSGFGGGGSDDDTGADTRRPWGGAASRGKHHVKQSSLTVDTRGDLPRSTSPKPPLPSPLELNTSFRPFSAINVTIPSINISSAIASAFTSHSSSFIDSSAASSSAAPLPMPLPVPSKPISLDEVRRSSKRLDVDLPPLSARPSPDKLNAPVKLSPSRPPPGTDTGVVQVVDVDAAAEGNVTTVAGGMVGAPQDTSVDPVPLHTSRRISLEPSTTYITRPPSPHVPQQIAHPVDIVLPRPSFPLTPSIPTPPLPFTSRNNSTASHAASPPLRRPPPSLLTAAHRASSLLATTSISPLSPDDEPDIFSPSTRSHSRTSSLADLLPQPDPQPPPPSPTGPLAVPPFELDPVPRSSYSSSITPSPSDPPGTVPFGVATLVASPLGRAFTRPRSATPGDGLLSSRLGSDGPRDVAPAAVFASVLASLRPRQPSSSASTGSSSPPLFGTAGPRRVFRVGQRPVRVASESSSRSGRSWGSGASVGSSKMKGRGKDPALGAPRGRMEKLDVVNDGAEDRTESGGEVGGSSVVGASYTEESGGDRGEERRKEMPDAVALARDGGGQINTRDGAIVDLGLVHPPPQPYSDALSLQVPQASQPPTASFPLPPTSLLLPFSSFAFSHALSNPPGCVEFAATVRPPSKPASPERGGMARRATARRPSIVVEEDEEEKSGVTGESAVSSAKPEHRVVRVGDSVCVRVMRNASSLTLGVVGGERALGAMGDADERWKDEISVAWAVRGVGAVPVVAYATHPPTIAYPLLPPISTTYLTSRPPPPEFPPLTPRAAIRMAADVAACLDKFHTLSLVHMNVGAAEVYAVDGGKGIVTAALGGFGKVGPGVVVEGSAEWEKVADRGKQEIGIRRRYLSPELQTIISPPLLSSSSSLHLFSSLRPALSIPPTVQPLYPSDIYALSVLLCELITLNLAFHEVMPDDIPGLIKTGARPEWDGPTWEGVEGWCARRARDIVEDGWAHEWERRPTAAQFRSALLFILAEADCMDSGNRATRRRTGSLGS
ncbi:hypothetical protein M427DRAFT_168053 [Gonapodya prolifera JEL478]|uniref:Protein kinase domain-containing protein n=1 Tax=Gonapodya prolifera (strain JEL478) TaxID=1344416 RepID=A0A139B0B9_GONPJ|nr:hypothetical protein M427DRAFT_168053 [Gonapodya prolifera JEL478]|eukprot:KXS22253.1 hypothetical protein M427DRAFT_168053 [Gonapodya prolifera JEL478]